MSLLQQPRFNSELSFALAFAAAVLVTLLLFYTMHVMISGRSGGLKSTESGPIIEFVHLKPDDSVATKNRLRPERPKLQKSMPPMPSRAMPGAAKPAMPKPQMAMPAPAGIKLQGGPFLGSVGQPGPAAAGKPGAGAPGAGAAGGFSANEDLVPLARIAPRYPRRAALEGIEGWVKIEFTVLEDGSVADPVVTEAKPGHIFNREAIRAILRWKFRPKLVDGKPVKQRASQTISFKLAK